MPLRNAIRRMSLTHRLLALTLVASLPGLAAVAYGAFDLRNTRYAEVRGDALRNAQVVASEVGQIFDGIQASLRAVAEADEVSRLNSTACTDYVVRVRPHVEPLTSLLIVGLDGNIRCFSEPSLASPNLAGREYFREAVDQKKFAIGPFTVSKISDRNIIPMAVPIIRDGKVEGAVVAGLNLEWLGEQLKQRGVPRGGTILIADRNGIVVSREPAPEKFVGTKLTDSLGRIGMSAPATDDIVGIDGVARIIGFLPASATPFGLYVSSGIAHSEAFGPIDRAVRNSIALFALGSAVAFLLAWLVGESIIRRPLMRMVATAEAWRRGHDAARTGIVGRDDEIGVLGQTFDRLMDENAMREEQRATAEERREILVHELAHRVKNTLATVQSIASLSFRHSQGPEALRQFHERLQALVRGHDLLTRKNWQHASLSEIAEAAMAPLHQDRGHRVTISGPEVDLPPTTAVPMAMILHELCTNALKYGSLSNENGRVTIGWMTRDDPRGTIVSLIWSESGGPSVTPPAEEGFGTRLITNLSRQLGGDCNFRYPPSGLVFHLSMVAPSSEPRHQANETPSAAE
ncbi:MAG: HAMP domain-containing protein [Bradyrhizobiaceae bacterium]|nr:MULTISPECIES: HWE histidine kinase domain-containing protein [Afipia]RTL78558.1 MAG: HAMP domain-containing protein [Bradyrhizobiaceae bacterium]HAO38998.1 HAMP domain-containing protein [Afipia sp.]HAP45796.1 HAMP domain-containing protein [Afipia sp.]HBF56846.1 HAMP domain-containing protein [Afipia sp.]HBR47446.1 HAMP domain-containing protein [Afipia sp.]